MLKPNNAWRWYFDNTSNSLMLDLGDDMVFRVAVNAKHLIPDAFSSSPFSVEDASLFQRLTEPLSNLSLSGPRQAELALNAVAAYRFHKPVLPKSWFFEPQQDTIATPEWGQIVELTSQTGDRAPFIIIENAGSASLCMLAREADFELSANKKMAFCGAIKVMNDRLSQPICQTNSQKGRFALVG
ncbi:cell division protein ZapC [Salinivibrio kushneri]|uniref:cell division protein ZapC n=1 Tax=Salinivibrio kushneri TaxID=1908198 RepID=UPI0009849CA9|nr:cell division protein ZapC [Salinivibrio kushneri]OOE52454.1 cell division protein ZapC [Salinivibrio kushneri]OOE52757.1 cell division protein ZapC [Salinivibrio kushneri]OOE59665.1 cell division protein ZapC [Salinivibrio kushneri]OOE71496.1 cell division protein ZapC [Salinivibrio kushneri]